MCVCGCVHAEVTLGCMYVCVCVCLCLYAEVALRGVCVCVCVCAEVTLGCMCNGFNIDTNEAQRSHWLCPCRTRCILRTAEAPRADLPWASESAETQNNSPSFSQGGPLPGRPRRGRKDESEQLPGASGTCNDKEPSQ